MGANVIRGILEKHSIYLEAHSILDLIRELYSNREVSIQDGEDARLLLKILFGVPWSRIEHAYETGQAIPSCFNYKVPFFKAIMLYQSYTPLTRTL